MLPNLNDHIQFIDTFLEFSGYPSVRDRGLYIGKTSPCDMPEALLKFIESIVAESEEKLEKTIPYSPTFASLMDNRLFTYEEFLTLFSEGIHEIEYLYHRAYDFFMIDSYEKKMNLLNGISREYEGYLRILKKSSASIIPFFFEPIEMKIPLDALERHMHILAKTGQGKSNIIKLLIHELQKEKSKKKSTIILIEPHGDLAKEVRDFGLNIIHPERLVYIDPYYESGFSPVINPFTIPETSDSSIDLYSQELSRVFVELLKEGTTMSSQMDAILRPAISTLLRMGNTTLEDLQNLMDSENSDVRKYIVEQGLQNPYPPHRKMFQKVWGDDEISSNYKPTLNSIYNKIQNLLNTSVFRNLTCGNEGVSTIHLHKEVNEGKVIIFNLSKGKMGGEASQAYGKFIVSLLQTIAFQRENQSEEHRVSTFAFIDEFQNYVTTSVEDILAEARKYAMHLILSHQSIGQITDTKLRDTLLGNTGVKAVGTSSKKTLRVMADEIDITLKEFSELNPYEFYVSAQSPKTGKKSMPYRIKPASHLTSCNSTYFQNDQERKAIKAYQLKRFYTSIHEEQVEKDLTSNQSSTSNNTKRQGPKFEL